MVNLSRLLALASTVIATYSTVLWEQSIAALRKGRGNVMRAHVLFSTLIVLVVFSSYPQNHTRILDRGKLTCHHQLVYVLDISKSSPFDSKYFMGSL